MQRPRARLAFSPGGLYADAQPQARPEAVQVALEAADGLLSLSVDVGGSASGSEGPADGSPSEPGPDGGEGEFAVFAALGHRIARNGPFIFCNACGAYCAQRLGPNIRSVRVPPVTGILPAGPKRALDQIREELHPKTGEPF